jgi:hypothetical protein
MVTGAISAAAVTLPSTASESGSPAFAHLDVASQEVAAGQRVGLDTAGKAAAGQGKQAAGKAAAAKASAAVAAARAVAAKAQAQAHAQAQAQAKIQQQAAASPQQVAKGMLGQFGWSSSQFSCLNPLWGQESRWSVTASNAGSGAYGIPQALPGSKMDSAGPDWQTSAATQIRWGLDYIQGTYGSPCAAWSHEQSDGWY